MVSKRVHAVPAPMLINNGGAPSYAVLPSFFEQRLSESEIQWKLVSEHCLRPCAQHSHGQSQAAVKLGYSYTNEHYLVQASIDEVEKSDSHKLVTFHIGLGFIQVFAVMEMA